MKGVLLIGGPDSVISGRAKSAGLPVDVADGPELRWEKTLIAEAGTRIPFDLLPAAWGFLERWDAAVPLWMNGKLAADVGDEADRRQTQAVIRDLRVPLHAVELLLVRRNEAGRALVAAWLEEMEQGQDRRLAFLRANYRVKPRLCVLPASWLVQTRPAGNGKARVTERVRPANAGRPLVQVELEPGRFVKVHAGDEERVRDMFARQRKGRN